MAVSEVNDEGKRRRLPPWMLGIGAPNRLTECCSSNDVCVKSKDSKASASISNATYSAAKRARRKKRTIERENWEAGSQVVVKCEKKKRRNIDEDAGDGGGGAFGDQKQKKTKDVTKSKKVMKSRNSDDSGDENCGVRTQEVDLTVEDCLAIAQEYVKANMDQEKRNREQRGSKETHRPSTNHVSVEPGTGFDATDTGKILPTYAVETPCTSPASFITDVASFSGTGDPAQDMLDLLLGPLLKKPKEVDK